MIEGFKKVGLRVTVACAQLAWRKRSLGGAVKKKERKKKGGGCLGGTGALQWPSV